MHFLTFTLKNKNLVIFKISGDLIIRDILPLRESFKHILEKSQSDIALDFSAISWIDSGGLGLLANLAKNSSRNKKKIYIFSPQESVLDLLKISNLDSIIEIHISIDSFLKKMSISDQEFQLALPRPTSVANEDVPSQIPLPQNSQINRLELICSLCQNDEVSGYLFKPGIVEQVWTQNLILEGRSLINQQPPIEDINRFQISLCPQCLMASASYSDFNFLNPQGVLVRAPLHESSLKLLRQGIKVRQKILDNSQISKNSFFYPRSTEAVKLTFLMALKCWQAITFLSSKKEFNENIIYNLYLAFYSDSIPDKIKYWKESQKHLQYVFINKLFYENLSEAKCLWWLVGINRLLRNHETSDNYRSLFHINYKNIMENGKEDFLKKEYVFWKEKFELF